MCHSNFPFPIVDNYNYCAVWENVRLLNVVPISAMHGTIHFSLTLSWMYPDISGMKLSSCDVTFYNDLRRCFSRKGGIGGGGWVHPKGADSTAVSGLRFENALVDSEATAILLCTNGLRKQSSFPARRPFPMGKHLSQSGRAVAGWVPWLLPAR